ncbi:S41 family peptidase [Bacteroides timonensis]|uniref:S41 family peptidase n=1 Tax=Bacteroides timonensis TaxID=1470345 RepID=UPI0004BADBFA|nr:S41 family peptidase [Bacteroides timonensis]
MKYKNLFKLFFLGCLTVLSSCEEDITTLASLDDTDFSTSTEAMTLSNLGGSDNVTFVTPGNWTLEATEEWLSISQTSGQKGGAVVVLEAETNTTGRTRTAYLLLNVEGYEQRILCSVTQTRVKGDGLDVNYWMADYMAANYLWNDEFKKVQDKLNYGQQPDEWLTNALGSMRTNVDDGYNTSEGRIYYSNITGQQVRTRAPGDATDYGVGLCQAGVYDQTYGLLYLIVNYVYKGSPADRAGVKRASLITKVNGQNLTDANINEAFYMLLGYIGSSSISLEVRSFQQVGENSYTISETANNVTLYPATYDANPILYADVFTSPDRTRKIGYFAYSVFDLNHDQEILNTFSKFKEIGLTDLIIDLRYNNGGYVYSSATLATAIVGSAYKGQVYSHMQFNEERTKKGEAGYFYIGENPSMVEYPLIEQALDVAVNMKRIYVLTTNNTASASELVINGLRGLDGIEVITVGTTTNGKNVGMEAINSSAEEYANLYNFDGWVYEFSPITFYNLNAKGSKDYADGFRPDFELDESRSVYGDWGNVDMDPLVNVTAYHILMGTWPTLTRTRSLVKDQPVLFKKIGESRELKGSIVLKNKKKF